MLVSSLSFYLIHYHYIVCNTPEHERMQIFEQFFFIIATLWLPCPGSTWSSRNSRRFGFWLFKTCITLAIRRTVRFFCANMLPREIRSFKILCEILTTKFGFRSFPQKPIVNYVVRREMVTANSRISRRSEIFSIDYFKPNIC